ncbi:hypothetical protein FH972_020993 [Carpinus fangiana]|uniref:Uncharacterized protein n=1 Tax=Carpinus fangiana TaxID=176857 RepID=A0A5N6KN17_9ROSI|nr:hypothetical protein FH972_020993 [Carpinus fangiana]
MVGVPTSKACAPCRKAKKKGTSAPASPTRAVTLSKQIRHADISWPVANDFSRFVSLFAHGVDASIDIRMQLPWNFGNFLEDVPRHLGTNEALDASAECLISAYSLFCRKDNMLVKPILSKYGRALSKLQQCLADPDKSHSTETLCATMVLMIFEVRSRTDDLLLSVPDIHSGGAAKILKSRGRNGPKNELEDKLILTLRGPVVSHSPFSKLYNIFNSQSFFQASTPFTPEEWTRLTMGETDVEECSIDEQMLRHFAQLPELMRAARNMLINSQGPPEPLELTILQHKIFQLRQTLGPVYKGCADRYHGLHGVLLSVGDKVDVRLEIGHAHCARTALLAITTHLVANCIAEGVLRHPQSGDSSSDLALLRAESAALSREVREIATQVYRHRPLGTIYMNFVLRVAWAGASPCASFDESDLHAQQDRLETESMLVDYGSDLHGIDLASGGFRRRDLEWLAGYLRLENVPTRTALAKFR